MRSIAVIALMGQVALGQFTNSSTSSTTLSTSVVTSTTRLTSVTTTTAATTTTDSGNGGSTDDGFDPDPPTSTDSIVTSTTSGVSTTTSGVSTSASASASVSPNPVNVGGFTLLGCYGSPSSYPTFTLQLSAESMTIDRCTAACPADKRYAALFGSDCFCGDTIDDVNEQLRPEAECNIPCPGNPRQRCGGRNAGAILKAKRQIIPSDIRFSIYVRVGAVVSVSGSVTVTITAPTTSGSMLPTFSPAPNPCSNGKCFGIPCFSGDCYKKFVSYGDYCGYDFPCFGPDCKRRLVWENGVWRPDVCNGYDCGRKVKCVSGKCKIITKGDDWDQEKITCFGNICKVEKCESDECNKKYVCKDDSCVFETCPKEDGNKKYECESDKCKVVKPCDVCPEPSPPSPLGPTDTAVPPMATGVQPPAGPDASAMPTDNGNGDETTVSPGATGDQPPAGPDATALPTAGGGEDATAVPPAATGGAGAGAGAGAGSDAGAGASGPNVVVPPGVTGTSAVVVTAGSNTFAASFGALAFSVIAAAILL